ncbi:MAG: META domain-containing protein [Alphaproteobacteria bacterium]|jgi:heat shock protein HslJ|nr:META domain-containing protein [Alphaproteobacteria bacterium]
MTTFSRVRKYLERLCRARLKGLGAGLLGLALSAPATATEPGSQPEAFGCAGNEPFWALTVDGPDGAFSRPGEGGVAETALAGGSRALGYLSPPIVVWRGGPADPQADGAEVAGDLVAGIFRQRCLDTMADLPPFRYRAVISLPDGTAATGCCLAAVPAELIGRAWRVVDVRGERIAPADEPPRLRFEEDGVSGTAGCNRFFGDLSIEGRTLTIGDLGTTRMSCPDPVMAAEQRLLDALQATAGYGLDGTLLVLNDADGARVLRLAPMMMLE